MVKHRLHLVLASIVFLLASCSPNRPPSATLNVSPLLLRVQVSWIAMDPEGDAFNCVLAFGDGESVSLANCQGPQAVAHTYAKSGSYTIQLRLTDSNGKTNEITRRVTLPARPSNACPAPPAPTQALSPQAKPQGVAFNPKLFTVPGRLIVRLSDSGLNLSSPIHAGAQLVATPLPGWAVLKVTPGKELEVAEQLVASGAVAYAQPVYRYRLLGVPDDTYFNDYQASQFEQMRLTEGWDLLQFGVCRPIVATVDSGADLRHTDLAANLLPGYDFSDNDGDPTDEGGHGTKVAGIIGAVTNNSEGVAGSTRNLAYVLPLKVFPSGDSATIAEAIRWAADAGSHLINLSLCVLSNHDYNEDGQLDCAAPSDPDVPDAAIESALEYAYYHGVIAVAASGNDGLDYVGYPASSVYTIAVGSVNSSNTRSSFSNYGSDLDFVAPGEDVASTIPDGTYGTGSGTSFATPYVSGVLALYLGQHYAVLGELPGFNQAFNCLANNTNQVDWNEQTGYGIPQADQVLDPADGTCYP